MLSDFIAALLWAAYLVHINPVHLACTGFSFGKKPGWNASRSGLPACLLVPTWLPANPSLALVSLILSS